MLRHELAATFASDVERLQMIVDARVEVRLAIADRFLGFSVNEMTKRSRNSDGGDFVAGGFGGHGHLWVWVDD